MFNVRIGKPRLNFLLRGQKRKVRELLAAEKEEDQRVLQGDELFKLATMHHTRYCFRNVLDDLILTTERLEEAIAKTPHFDYKSLVERLGFAARCYYALYDKEKDRKYLRAGSKAGEKAMEAAHVLSDRVSKRNRAILFYTQACCLAQLGEWEQNHEMIQRAIQLAESALENAPENAPENEDSGDDEDDDEDKEQRRRDQVEYRYWVGIWKGMAAKLGAMECD